MELCVCHISKKIVYFFVCGCLLFNPCIYLILLQVSYLVMFAYISLTLGDIPHPSSFYISSKVHSQPYFENIFLSLSLFFF